MRYATRLNTNHWTFYDGLDLSDLSRLMSVSQLTLARMLSKRTKISYKIDM